MIDISGFVCFMESLYLLIHSFFATCVLSTSIIVNFAIETLPDTPAATTTPAPSNQQKLVLFIAVWPSQNWPPHFVHVLPCWYRRWNMVNKCGKFRKNKETVCSWTGRWLLNPLFEEFDRHIKDQTIWSFSWLGVCVWVEVWLRFRHIRREPAE